MFATNARVPAVAAPPGDDDDDWLRVGQSFKSATPKGDAETNGEQVEERALQVYKKRKKESRSDAKRSQKKKKKKSSSVSSDSDSSSDDSRRRKHKRSKKSKKKDAKHKKHRRSSSRTQRSEYSDSSSSYGSSGGSGNERRLVKKRRRRGEEGDQHGDASALTLVESPRHGELEIYQHYQQNLGEEKLFEFDGVGDRDNSFYGSLYKAEQPLYRLATRRSVVDGQWIVDRPKRVATTDTKPSEDRFEARYFGSEARKTERRQGAKRLHLAYSERRLKQIERGDNGDTHREMAFIPLGIVVDGELRVQDDENNEDKEDADEADGFQTLWKTDQESMEQFLVAKNKQLNERVNSDPSDVEAWLDLIAFQDEMQRLSGKTNRRNADQKISSRVDAVVLEKQRAVLEKALVTNPESKQLRRLQLNLLWSEQHTSGRAMDIDSYRGLVEQMLENDPSNAELWTKLIVCMQQKFASFSMTMLRDLYARVVAVLNKELTRLMHNKDTIAKAKAASSCIHVVGNKSLLGKMDPYEGPMDDAVAVLASVLIAFHESMARAEISAGFQERGVAQIQALIDFNIFTSGGGSVAAANQDLLEKFGAMWTEATSHFGDEVFALSAEPYQPSTGSWATSYTKAIQDLLDKVNPPAVVFSPEHTVSLLGIYNVEEDNDDADSPETSNGVTPHESTTPRGKWVYSNLHGQRIWIADADETSSYERILDELRGSERFQERQQVQERKLGSKREKRASLLAKFRDERADHPFIVPGEDVTVRWLANELLAEMTQWKPLQSSDPSHASLIESQPDRVILTEEITPFVFRVPRVLQSELVLNLLAALGVRLTQRPLKSSPWTQVTDDFESWPVLTQPILNALDASTDSSIGMSSQDRYALIMRALQRHVVVDNAAALDPDRVQFIRNVFASQLNVRGDDDDVRRLFKVLWMEYEAEVALKSSENESSSAKLRIFCQQLLQPANNDVAEGVDAELLSAYATIELRLGYAEQAARVCEKTLASLYLHTAVMTATTPRSFHRLIYLRVRHAQVGNVSRSHVGHDVRRLQALYSLWQPWQPQAIDSLEQIVKQYRKKPGDLIKHLQQICDDNKDEVVERYRFELDVAQQQCRRKSSKSTRPVPLLECDVPFALSNLCSALYATHGFHAALSEYKQFVEELRLERATCCHARACYLMYFAFIQGHQWTGGFPQMAPRDWRSIVGAGVAVFPLDQVFLRLFVDAETSNTISQTLRKYFQTRRDTWRRYADSPEMVEWLFALLCELARAERFGLKFCSSDSVAHQTFEGVKCCVLHRWGKNRPAVERIRRVFEEMFGQVNTSGNAVAWRLYVRFELAVGRVEAARKVFYRGLVKCPWSKALYLDGFRVLRPYLSRDECQELSEFLIAKELHVRVDDDQE